MGFGLAGGGYGAYEFCTNDKCNQFTKWQEEDNALDTIKRPIPPHQEGVDTSQEEGVVGDRQRGAEEDR